MSPEITLKQEDIDRLFLRLKTEAESAGYFLNPDTDFTKSLVRGLLLNEDLDIICPCDYRDADLGSYDTCY